MLCPRQSRLEAAAIGTFVAHGPADHTGAVLIPDHTPLGTIQRRFQKVGVIRKGFIPVLHMVLPQLVFRTVHFRRAVALMVCLVNDHKAVLVAELIEHGGVGIVSGANGIEVVLLHHFQIPLQMLQGGHRTGDGVRIMPVHATELDGVSVQVNLVILNADFPEPPTINNNFIGGFQNECVQVWLLRIPKGGLLNHHNRLMGERTAGLHRTGSALGNHLVVRVQ